jgi:hypothetical protein
MPRLSVTDCVRPTAAGGAPPRGRIWGLARELGRRARVTGGPALAVLLAACQPSIEPEDGATLIRFVNAASDAQGPLGFVFGGNLAATLLRGEESGYAEVSPGIYPITIEDDGANWTVTGNLNINRGFVQTLYAFGVADAEAAILVGDEPRPPGDTQALVRILHLAGAAAAAVDVHILQVGEAVNPANPTAIGLAFATGSTYVFVNAGSHRLVITERGTANIVIDSGALEFSQRAPYTAVLLNDNAGAPELIRLRDGA